MNTQVMPRSIFGLIAGSAIFLLNYKGADVVTETSTVFENDEHMGISIVESQGAQNVTEGLPDATTVLDESAHQTAAGDYQLAPTDFAESIKMFNFINPWINESVPTYDVPSALKTVLQVFSAVSFFFVVYRFLRHRYGQQRAPPAEIAPTAKVSDEPTSTTQAAELQGQRDISPATQTEPPAWFTNHCHDLTNVLASNTKTLRRGIAARMNTRHLDEADPLRLFGLYIASQVPNVCKCQDWQESRHSERNAITTQLQALGDQVAQL